MPPSTPPTPTQQALQTANQTYASTFSPSTLPPGPSPTKHLAIVTCMDARIHPEAAFGLALGDAHVIRNGGGWAKDALRSLVPSQQLLGTREVVVVKHTDCGYTHLKHPLLYGKIGLNLGVSAASQASSMDFLPFTDLEEAVRDDVTFLREHPLIGEDVVVSGWVYETESGRVRRLDC